MRLLHRKDRPPNRYELLTCGLKGHALVGTDAAKIVSPDDDLLVREHGGLRWHRCLRCDAWLAHHPPQEPRRDRIPQRHEIEIPLRGPALRDRYILRLIALDRAIHVLVLVGVAVAVLFFVGHEKSLQRDFTQIMNALYGTAATSKESHGILHSINNLLVENPNRLYEVAAAAIAYAALEATEMVGLWFAKRWAEYLTFLATILLLPLEIYEIAEKVTVIRSITLAINLAIAIYLLLAKRLFGLRGGYAAEEEKRRVGAGWPAIEGSTPNPALSSSR